MFKLKPNNYNCFESIKDEEILLLASKVVNRYASKGSIPHREKEDVAMSIVEKFLTKKELISKNFQCNSKFSTYCISILNNMCCEIIRRDLKHWNIQDTENQQFEEQSELSSIDKLAIKDEIRYLHKIILLFGDQTPKVRLFTAFYLYLSILEKDMQKYDAKYIKNNLIDLLTLNENLSKGEIFKKLSEVVNIVENKDSKPDAIRMWLNKTRNIIIDRLNMSKDNTHYDTESYHILFEYYYTGYEKDSQNIEFNKASHGN